MPLDPNLIERRAGPGLELRVEDGELPMIRGYASVFGKLSEPIMGMFREQVAPGAFAPLLARGPDTRALFNHDPNFVLGRTKAGTLRLREDDRGLQVEIDPPDTQVGRDVVTSIRRGDISGMSIGFTVQREEWSQPPEGSSKLAVRTVLEFGELFDISPVTFPAFRATSVSARALLIAGEALAEDELDDAERARVLALIEQLRAGNPLTGDGVPLPGTSPAPVAAPVVATSPPPALPLPLPWSEDWHAQSTRRARRLVLLRNR